MRSELYKPLLDRLGITLDDELLQQALTHRSYAYEAGLTENNERLEFLGDSVLGVIVTEVLYNDFPALDESKLSPLRSAVVNMRALADIARQLELGKYLRIGKGEEVTQGREKNSILADSLEALFGAIYLTHGFAKSVDVILPLLRPAIERAHQSGAGVDGKTALQELMAARSLGAPEYLISESGPDHDKSFIATAIVAGSEIASGTGKSKREAEQSAARAAVELLENQL